MNNTNLTDRQYSILKFICNVIDEMSRPPTVREIGHEFSIDSTKGVADHLDALERKGWIEREPGQARGIRPVRERTKKLLGPDDGLPIVGSVVAGGPSLARENLEGILKLDDLFPNRDDLFALRVRGDSMSGAGIYKGDIVIVRGQPQADMGDIVVAIVDDELGTVKKLSKIGEKIHLEPANPDYDTIVKKPGEVEIRGKVIGVIRKM